MKFYLYKKSSHSNPGSRKQIVIPLKVLEALRKSPGEKLLVKRGQDQVILTLFRPRPQTLADWLAPYLKDKVRLPHDTDLDWGESKGKEIW